MSEVRSLRRNTQQQPEPTPLLQRGFKKWASSNLNQDDSWKWHKAAQLKENQLPKIAASSQLETDLIENFLSPVAADTDQQGRFIENSQGMMEMCWMTSRWDDRYSDGKGSDNDGRDEEEEEEDRDEDEDRQWQWWQRWGGGRGGWDEDEDKDKDEDGDKDEDKDELVYYDSEIPGISNWDFLGKDFECEAAALGLYPSYELPTQLTTF